MINAAFTIRPFSAQDCNEVFHLWELCGVPARVGETVKDLEALSIAYPDLFLLGFINNDLVASVLASYDGRRGTISHLSVHPDFQKCGLATSLLEIAEANLKEKSCSKINITVDPNNDALLKWYEKRGYARTDFVFMSKAGV